MKEKYTDFKERCWTIYGFITNSIIIGFLKESSINRTRKTNSVEFGWEKNLSKFVIGWFHTHNNDIALKPSQEDEKTMRSWVRSFNKPFICGIMYENKNQYLWKNCYIFKRGTNKAVYFLPILKNLLLFKRFYIGKL